jgi:hypothetical protein
MNSKLSNVGLSWYRVGDLRVKDEIYEPACELGRVLA